MASRWRRNLLTYGLVDGVWGLCARFTSVGPSEWFVLNETGEAFGMRFALIVHPPEVSGLETYQWLWWPCSLTGNFPYGLPVENDR